MAFLTGVSDVLFACILWGSDSESLAGAGFCSGRGQRQQASERMKQADEKLEQADERVRMKDIQSIVSMDGSCCVFLHTVFQ